MKLMKEASFDLLLSSLEELWPLLFSLDHIHYFRWIPVFIHDLKLLKAFDPKLYECLSKGTVFSKIAFDQAHEQNNKVISNDIDSKMYFYDDQSICYVRNMEISALD